MLFLPMISLFCGVFVDVVVVDLKLPKDVNWPGFFSGAPLLGLAKSIYYVKYASTRRYDKFSVFFLNIHFVLFHFIQRMLIHTFHAERIGVIAKLS